MRVSKPLKINALSYTIALCAAFTAGAIPAGLVFGVDPYEVFRPTDRTTKIQDIAEKAHYPLWKLAKYQQGQFDTIILGDSRARSLRDKYWHELGVDNALNLAYGGGTIPEIYSTFQVIKDDPAVKNLVVGIQLRSFDEDHKGDMNRVPEAEYIVNNRTEYLKNWSIFKTAWKMMSVEEKETFDNFDAFAKKFSMAAKADELAAMTIFDPSDPQVDVDCFDCDLKSELNRLTVSERYQILDKNLSFRADLTTPIRTSITIENWSEVSHLYSTSNTLVPLPKKMANQVTRNAKSDWVGFEFSSRYWSYITEISHWAEQNNKNLIFVIPPTIEDMQRTISIYGMEKSSHEFRMKLAKLGTVIDFDYSNDLTKQIDNFSDAYHFKSTIAKKIVGEITGFISVDPAARKLAIKRSDLINCSPSEINEKSTKVIDKIALTNINNCRVWRVL
ncbi:MAG: hypothetical protein ABJE63_00730 [Lentilitoribacter sp.]